MNVQNTFSAASYPPLFSPAVNALAVQSLTTAILPGTWTKTRHPYAKAHGIDLYRSDLGAWGVSHPRFHFEALSELFVSRAALYAGVPVAPTFLHQDDDFMPRIMSIVPFDSVVSNAATPYHQMPGFLKHYASSLPFFLWLGNDADRKFVNVTMNGEDFNAFGEFDFENCDLANVFRACTHDADDLPAELRAMQRMSIERAVRDKGTADVTKDLPKDLPILQTAFEEGWMRLDDMPQDVPDKVLDVIGEAQPVSALQRKNIPFYLSLRHRAVSFARLVGDLDPFMVDTLPQQAAVSPDYVKPWTYHFK